MYFFDWSSITFILLATVNNAEMKSEDLFLQAGDQAQGRAQARWNSTELQL